VPVARLNIMVGMPGRGYLFTLCLLEMRQREGERQREERARGLGSNISLKVMLSVTNFLLKVPPPPCRLEFKPLTRGLWGIFNI
jgi:hypothetical protein